MYLVSKAQDSGVKCSSLHSNLAFSRLTWLFFFLAAEWRNDTRNPYAAQLAKGALH